MKLQDFGSLNFHPCASACDKYHILLPWLCNMLVDYHVKKVTPINTLIVSENVNRPKDFNLAKKNEMMMDRKVMQLLAQGFP